MESDGNYTSVAEVEHLAATQGIIFTPADRAKITAVQRAEFERLESTAPAADQTFADKWNRFYPRLLQFVITLGETVLTFSQTVITALGVPLVLVLLLIVEHHRVVQGIMLFDDNPMFSGFAAAALVILNLVLEFQVHHIEHRAGYTEQRATRWSLRIFARNAAYRLGLGDKWTAQQLSPAARYKGLLRLVTFSILALALVGSMRVVIESTEGVWYDAMVNIVTQSSLLLMLTWLGGLLFAGAAVLSAQGLSRYVAIRCVEIVAQMDTHHQDNPFAQDIDRAGAIAALAILNEKAAKAKAKKEQATPPVPLSLSLPSISTNGNGRYHNDG